MLLSCAVGLIFQSVMLHIAPDYVRPGISLLITHALLYGDLTYIKLYPLRQKRKRTKRHPNIALCLLGQVITAIEISADPRLNTIKVVFCIYKRIMIILINIDSDFKRISAANL